MRNFQYTKNLDTNVYHLYRGRTEIGIIKGDEVGKGRAPVIYLHPSQYTVEVIKPRPEDCITEEQALNLIDGLKLFIKAIRKLVFGRD